MYNINEENFSAILAVVAAHDITILFNCTNYRRKQLSIIPEARINNQAAAYGILEVKQN